MTYNVLTGTLNPTHSPPYEYYTIRLRLEFECRSTPYHLNNVTVSSQIANQWFDWSLTDFIHGTLSLSNTYFRQHFLNKITDAQRQSELFVHELLDLREQSSILANGMTLQRSEIDSLIAYVCCT